MSSNTLASEDKKKSNKKVDFIPYLESVGWKDEWADENKFSGTARVDNISKITNGVVHGLVEKLIKSPFHKKRCLYHSKGPCSSRLSSHAES